MNTLPTTPAPDERARFEAQVTQCAERLHEYFESVRSDVLTTPDSEQTENILRQHFAALSRPTTPAPSPSTAAVEAAKEIKSMSFKHEFDGTPQTWCDEMKREELAIAAIIDRALAAQREAHEVELADLRRTVDELVTDGNAVTLAESLQRKDAECADLRTQLSTLTAALEEARAELSKLVADYKELQNDAADAAKDNIALRATIAQLTKERSELQEANASWKVSVDASAVLVAALRLSLDQATEKIKAGEELATVAEIAKANFLVRASCPTLSPSERMAWKSQAASFASALARFNADKGAAT